MYKFVHQLPGKKSVVDGNRIWEEIKKDIEMKLGGAKNKTPQNLSHRIARIRSLNSDSMVVAYYQHMVELGEYEILHLKEFVPANTFLIIQRLPKYLALQLYKESQVPEYKMDEQLTEEQRIERLLSSAPQGVDEVIVKQRRSKRTSFAIIVDPYFEEEQQRKSKIQEKKRKRRKKAPAGVPKMFLDRKIGEEGEAEFVWNLDKSNHSSKINKVNIIE